MPDPPIPNLFSLRGTRGSRGSARGGRGVGRGGMPSPRSHEANIQGTDTDAAVSRLSAVDAGYLHDPYARYFVQGTDAPVPRRLPIINRGTYTRTTALNALVDSFLSDTSSPNQRRQIVSLGAGTDTRPFRIFAEGDRQNLVYHEIDFDLICRNKLRAVQGIPELRNILPASSTGLTVGEGPSGITSWSSHPRAGGQYYCHGIDLRQLSPEHGPDATIPGLCTDIPTLVLSECCLCYLPPSDASRVLDFFIRLIPSIAVAIYEPIRPDDAFGKMMVSNLAARHIAMPTLDAYRDGASQENRLRLAGLDTVRHRTIDQIWDTWVRSAERERVDGLEGLDEVEEWKLLAGHYVVAWGSRGDALQTWGEIPSQGV